MASSRSPISPTFRSGSSQGAPRTTNCTSAAVELASAIHNRHRVIIPTTACLALSSPRQSLGTGVPPRRLRIARILAFNFCVKWENQRESGLWRYRRLFVRSVLRWPPHLLGRGLSGNRAFAAVSLGGRERMFGPQSMHGELETAMLRDFFQGMLGYVGLTVHQPFVPCHVPYVEDAVRTGTLAELHCSVVGLDARPLLPMPVSRSGLMTRHFFPKLAPFNGGWPLSLPFRRCRLRAVSDHC
jgi:hypothetical protein